MDALKRISLVLVLSAIGLTIAGQVPDGLNYQAILRDISGQVIAGQAIKVRFRIKEKSTGNLLWEEEHNTTTTGQGLINLVVGSGTKTDGTAANFGDIVWQSDNMLIETGIYNNSAWHDFPSTQIVSVPYAKVAEFTIGDNDRSPLNEIITSSVLNGLTLEITEAGNLNAIDLSSLKDSPFMMNGDTASLVTGSLAIGSSNPGGSKLAVISQDDLSEEALFEVKRQDGQTVFAVYSEGVRVFLPTNPATKKPKGGFAIGGFDAVKGAYTEDYLWVTPDSIRMYIDKTPDGKRPKGGFAIGGFDRTKAVIDDYMVVNADSTRFYIDDTGVKGPKGGFAIGGFNPLKGTGHDYMRVTPDSTRIYVKNQAKGPKGGFAIGGFNPLKGPAENFINLTPDNYFIGHRSGKYTSTGLYNSFLGYESGYLNQAGQSNAFFGFRAGYNNTSGSNNLFLGYQSGYQNTTGNYNSFMGYQSGYNNITGTYNTFIGSYSGVSNSSGTDNTFAGWQSGYSNTSGGSNNFYGTLSGYSNTDGVNNIFIGPGSGYLNTSGSYNTFVGYHAGYSNTANNNVFIGNECGLANTSGTVNVFVGYAAGKANINGSSNVFIGNGAGIANIDGSSNVFMGQRAGFQNESGESNVFIGSLAGYSGTSAMGNVAIGYNSGYDLTVAYNNVFIGTYSGANTTWGESNVFIGTNAGMDNVTGGSNVIVGQGAGQKSTASDNVLLGYAAGYETTGNANVFAGNQAGYNNTSGANNVFIGNMSGYFSSTGSGNIFLGYQAGWNETGSGKLYIDNSSTTAPLIYGDFTTNYLTVNGDLSASGTWFRLTNNPGSGGTPAYYAFQGTAASSTKSGAFSIRDPLWVTGTGWFDGSVNIATYLTVGSSINVNSTGKGVSIHNAEALWYDDNYFSWGYGGNYNYFARRVTIGNSVGSGSYMLYVQGNAYATGVWNASDIRLKKDIDEIKSPLAKIMQLRGVTYNWRTNEFKDKNLPDGRHYGVIAQEVEKILPEMVNETKSGEKSVAYNELIPVLIEAVKEQENVIRNQEEQNMDLQKQIDNLKNELAVIKAALSVLD